MFVLFVFVVFPAHPFYLKVVVARASRTCSQDIEQTRKVNRTTMGGG